MSGICGAWLFNGGDPEFEPMLTLLERRGPEGTSSWADGPVALAHTLLATTPEALAESLPLSEPASGCTITADARLDNRDFLISSLDLGDENRTIGDGELILRSYLLWGEECPKHLLGDFAFAIWDPRSNIMFCARDHMGMRQLIYYYSPEKLFAFATEVNALVASPNVPRVVNDARIADFLDDLESIDFTSTFFEEVYRLSPAHTLTISAKGGSLRRYWQVSPGRELKLDSDEAYEEAFLKVFSEAVGCRLRSLGPVGSMLSGGLDSNTVSAVAANILAVSGGEPLQVFSAIASNVSSCAETRYIRAAIQNKAFSPTLIDLAQVDELLPSLIDLARESAEPFDAQMTLIRAVYLKANQAGLKSVLDGVSGDFAMAAGNGVARYLRKGKLRRAWREARGREAFWGSPPGAKRILAEAAWAVFVPRPLRALRRKIITAKSNREMNRGGHLVSKVFARSVGLQARREARRRLDGSGPSLNAEDRARFFSHPALATGRERYDRIASTLAIEPRDPFLDIRVIAFCLSLPPEQLERGGWPKVLIRRAVQGLVSHEVAWRAGKQHLGLLFNTAMVNDRAHYTTDEINLVVIRRFLSMETLRKFNSASTVDFRPYFKILALSRWLDRWAIRRPVGGNDGTFGSAKAGKAEV